MHLLIADDHDLVLDAVRSLLEHELPDAKITIMRDGDVVRTALQNGDRYDLALLDLRMPGITGVQDVKELIAMFSDQPIAILSGVAGQMEITALLESGARGFIPKTMPGDGLVAAVRLILAGQVARLLDIQETTVKLHLRSLALKLEARNRTEVVVKAIQSGLIA